MQPRALSHRPIPEGGRIRPQNRRESVGTNPPETTFTWTDLKGDDHFSEFDYCDQGVQTSLPSAHVPFVADAKIGEGVKAWRAGKYKTKSGGGDGGDSGSDGSGDESKRKRSNSSDSDDSERHRRKKKGMTRDYLRTIPKKPLLASPVRMMALMGETPGLARGVGMPYFGYPAMPMGYAPGPYGFPSQLTLREKPTIEKLCLSRLDVPRLLLFREKFVRLQQSNYPEQLLITHYLDSRVMAILLATIRTEDRFADLWDKIKIFGGAIQAEHQLLDNNEVYGVLAFIARPKSKLEMDTWLGQSVWDSTSYSKFKNNRSYIQTYIDYYLHAWSHYRERFEILMEILCHDDTKKYFPAYVKKKNGVNGLIDYFINGTPDVGFTKQVNEKYITNERYDEIEISTHSPMSTSRHSRS